MRLTDHPVICPDVSEARLLTLSERVNKTARSLRRTLYKPPGEQSVPGYFRVPVTVQGSAYMMPLGWLGTTGCAWAGRGGCTMCDYGAYAPPVSTEGLLKQVDLLFHEWRHEKEVHLSALGSFFDDTEMPAQLREHVARAARKTKTLDLLSVEARPDHVTQDKVQVLTDILGADKVLEVGLGLESSDGFVRNVCVNKRLSLADFEHSLAAIRAAHAEAVVHVLLKPPFLTEAEAIEDAVASMHYLAGFEIRRVVLMASNVKRGTVVGALHERGTYRVPWLWSILEVLRRLDSSMASKTLVYGFACGIPMLDVARNCDHCTSGLRALLHQFCGTHDTHVLDAALATDCDCRRIWRKEIEDQPGFPIEKRVESLLEGLSTEETRTVA